MHITEKQFLVIVKAGSSRNSILGFDSEKKAYVVSIKERAEDNKANKELTRFLSKEIGKKVQIKSGFNSRVKVIVVE